jgi:hypothetical protein
VAAGIEIKAMLKTKDVQYLQPAGVDLTISSP